MSTPRIVDPELAVEYRRDGFLVSTAREQLDLDVVYGFLTNCYWAKGIPREVVERSVAHALCFGVYEESASFGDAKGKHPAPKQVGFARVISDFATIAYIGDVFVLEAHRGLGLGKWLMECITTHPALQNLRRQILTKRDADGLYSQFVYPPVKAPERFME